MFEVFNRDKKKVYTSLVENDYPEVRIIENMSNAGYTFKVDGNKISKKQLIDLVKGIEKDVKTKKSSKTKNGKRTYKLPKK